MKRIVLIIVAPVIAIPLLWLAIYGTPETRVRNALIEAGLSEPRAECMASRLMDDLSYRQMWQLSSLRVFKNRDARDLSLREFVHATRGLQDRQVWRIAARISAICALRTR